MLELTRVTAEGVETSNALGYYIARAGAEAIEATFARSDWGARSGGARS